ncbi:50S ribosomal protein L23 [Bacteroidetes bacterium UKL13-3]|jgi:large subunit ribosomal protein L23|nr:50S ribosomal protein L23 [Bacteroidetes bacterium UKL13-3]HCP93671.1 50S ribosomal protein L23 [Bacteroidota bacterium]
MSTLKKPLITEKSTAHSEKLGQFGFIVSKTATKPEIIKEIEALYSVNVTGISTMRYAGKAKSRFTKKGLFEGRKPAFKKAIVTLKDGQVIDFFQNI